MQHLFILPTPTQPAAGDSHKLTCFTCGLSKDCENPKLPPQGGYGKKILIVGDCPTEIEDTRARVWGTSTGRLLANTLKDYGISLENDCLTTFAVCCHTPKSLTGVQVDCCRKNVLKYIQEYKPTVIIVLGDIALQSVVGHRWRKRLDNIYTWRGFCIPDQEYQAWVCPIWHPNFIEQQKSPEFGVIWRQDISNIVSHINTPVRAEKPPLPVFLDNDLTPLYDIKANRVAIDFETTGLKPHATGHRIVCASVAVSETITYVFPIHPLSRQELAPFLWLLKNTNIGKIAHNMKYEHTWAMVRLLTEITPWDWDTMLATHVLDNRPNICSLKFQTYLNFGVAGYDDAVAPYLQSDGKDGNGINSVMGFIEGGGLPTLMRYCAMDSHYTYRLAMKQMELIDGLTLSKDAQAYQLLHDGALALVGAELQGIRVDIPYFEKTKEDISAKIKELEDTFCNTKFYAKWCEYKPNPNINSGQQLANYLFRCLGLKSGKTTQSGADATDEEVLESLGIPELSMLLEIKKWKKVRDTYIESFMREQVKGIIHPFFNLHTVKTFRSSSDRPNFQNIPKRDKEVTKIIRTGLIPSSGNLLMEADFSAIEVSIAACYHKDPVMLDYLLHGKDLHADMAAQIFMVPKFDKHNPHHSLLRKAAKNGFVFPQFYGDYYGNNATGLCQWVKLPTTGKWAGNMGVNVSDGVAIASHLITKKITNFNQFVQHMKGIEDDFWNNRFKVYAQWKRRWVKQYQHNGYFQSHTGFTFKGVMGNNDAINYPVQGAAFHCLLWTFIQLSTALKRGLFKTKLIGQIHDALVLDVCPDEKDEVIALLKDIAEVQLQHHWPWIIVPMRIEIECSTVDGTWADMSEE